MRTEQDEGKFPPMLREVDLGVRHRTDHPRGGMVPLTHQVPADLGQSSGWRTGCVKLRQPAYKTIQLPACSGFQAPLTRARQTRRAFDGALYLGWPESVKVGLLKEGKLVMAEAPEPQLSGGDMVVSMRACGLCGSDIEKIRGHYGATGRIGHEPAGIVRSVAPGVSGFSPGDRVFVHHHVPCYTCEVCRAGSYTFCPSYQKTNIEPGGFAEAFRVPPENVGRGAVLPLPPSMSFEEATLIEPLGCCLTALWSTRFRPGDSALILGLGPIGLLYLRLLRTAGAGRLVGGDVSAFRRKMGEASGADRTFDPTREPVDASGGFDLVVVATSATAAVARGFTDVRPGGTLNLFGLPPEGSQLPVDLQRLYLKGVRLIPSYATTEHGTNRALELISSGRVPVRDLITHRVPLSDLPRAVGLAAQVESTIKIVVTA